MQYVNKNDKTPYLLMAAAVSDFVPVQTHEGKLKKEELGEHYSLELKRNVDVLSILPKKGFKVIGFKAEMDESKALGNAGAMLEKKGLDAVCLNVLKEHNTFGSSKNEVSFITASHIQKFSLAGKFEIAEQIVEQCSHL